MSQNTARETQSFVKPNRTKQHHTQKKPTKVNVQSSIIFVLDPFKARESLNQTFNESFTS